MKKSTQLPTGRNGSFLQLLRSRNFRLLWAAGTLSAIGDQFDLITFPWLVLLITGDPLAVGTIIAVSSIPTIFFMLIGGSLVDRFSPHLIM
ncbi:MAG: MFS transporter, partial [Chloroflexota bacterium]|nr:MFS transporter [Chloroflexota bacterium]